MPAKSKAQQRFMGMVHSYNKGDMKDAPASVKKAAKGMTKKSAKDFASTKHKGKPEHVAEALRRLIRQEIRAYNEAISKNDIQDLAIDYLGAMGQVARVSKSKYQQWAKGLKSSYNTKQAKDALISLTSQTGVASRINKSKSDSFMKKHLNESVNEAKTINVEPNWEGLYRFMMHMRKGDNAAFVRVTRKMGADWKKLEQMAQKKQWYVRGDFSESVNEKVANPFSQHLRDAQEEVEYMISHHPGAAEEGVYDKPKQAIKFLQVAQKALGKIT